MSGEYRIQTHSILPLIIPRHFHTAHSLPCSRFLVCHETLRDIPKNRCEGDYTVHSAPCLPSKLCMRIVLGDTKCIMSNMKAVNTEVSNGHLNIGKWIKRCFSASFAFDQFNPFTANGGRRKSSQRNSNFFL